MRQRLETVLSSLETSAVAVSGGVDSMTLAVIAHRLLGRERVTMMHAASPAVPPEATERVRHFAEIEGWDLRILDAGEFADKNYISNPINQPVAPLRIVLPHHDGVGRVGPWRGHRHPAGADKQRRGVLVDDRGIDIALA